MILRGLAVWLVLMLVEVLQGTVRTFWLAPRLGDFRARQVAVFTGSFLILLIVYLFIPWLGVRAVSSLLCLGLLWLLLTLVFEVALGRFVLHATWSRIFEDFNLPRGGLLPLGLLILFLAPLLAAKARGLL